MTKKTKRSSRARMTRRAFNRSVRNDSHRARQSLGGITAGQHLLNVMTAITAALTSPLMRRRQRKTQSA